MELKNKFQDNIINLPTDKTELNADTLNLIQGIFDVNEVDGNNNKTIKQSKRYLFLKNAVPYIITSVLFLIFNLPNVDSIIEGVFRQSNFIYTLLIKTMIFILSLYILLNIVTKRSFQKE